MKKIIVLAGATGNLGERIAKALLNSGAAVHIIARPQSDLQKIKELEDLGATVFRITHWSLEELTTACRGAACVVSALAGLREVIIDAQKLLLDAAIAADVPRFIPSDYSLDFTRFTDGENRNLDLRREFHTFFERAPISPTTIFNGAFTGLITNEMPMILFKQKLILYWGNGDHPLEFTTLDNTATFTAFAALDASTPRYLRIAGDQISPRELRSVASKVYGEKFRLLRTGGKHLLGIMIKLARLFAPGKNELYPAWQGMQYMHNMIDDRSTTEIPDNHRYPGIHWTSVREVLINYKENSKAANQ